MFSECIATKRRSKWTKDINDLSKDALEKEKEVEELDKKQERENLNRIQRRLGRTTICRAIEIQPNDG